LQGAQLRCPGRADVIVTVSPGDDLNPEAPCNGDACVAPEAHDEHRGPFRGAGIVVTALAADWRHARVVLRERALNRNYVGVHFGGSLFAMTDPFRQEPREAAQRSAALTAPGLIAQHRCNHGLDGTI
jgi:hypothetical protein